MVPDSYPPQQPKTAAVVAAQRALAISKLQQGQIADTVARSAEETGKKRFAKAVAKSCRLMAEDILRESGYMLPQSGEAREMLESMLENDAPGLPKDAVQLLLSRL